MRWVKPFEARASEGVLSMADEIYTLGVWRVKDEKQDEFVAAWQELGRYFNSLRHPPGKGTLLQSVDEPQRFFSFGPWRSLDDIQEMRGLPETHKEIGKLMDLCEEGRPGTFRVVATA
jgi:heme-degrading monooxygenase HmoA